MRFGVLGCSSVARRRFLPALAASERAGLVAVASRDASRAERFAAEFGAQPCEDYETLLARSDVDAVYLSVPNSLHTHWTHRVINAGKHVLVEKPLATRAQEAEEVFAMAARRGVRVVENRMFTHHTQHEAIAGMLADGVLGDLRVMHAVMTIPPLPDEDIRYRPELGGGALLDVGYYPLHAGLLHAGELELLGAALQMDAERGVDLGGSALLVSASGVPVHVVFGFDQTYRTRYELVGSAGRLTLDRAFTPPDDHQPVVRIETREGTRELVLPAAAQFTAAIDAFVAGQHGERHRRTTVAGLALMDALREVAVRR